MTTDSDMELYALQRIHEAVLTQDSRDLLLLKQLSPEHFNNPTCCHLFASMLDAHDKHGDSVHLGHIDDAVCDRLPDMAGYKWLPMIIDAPYLGAPQQIVARLSEELALRSALAFRADERHELSGQFTAKGEEIRSLLRDPLRVTDEEIIERMMQDRPSVPTGYSDMDRMLGGGIEQGAVFVVAARTGVGKTTLGVNLCAKAIHAGKSAFFLTLEMSEEGVYERMLQCVYGISRDEVRKNARGMGLKNSFRVSSGSSQLPKVLSVLQENAHHDILVVDYFQLIAGKGETQVQQLEQVSNEIKRFALDHRKPIIVLAQLNRNIESDRVNREPDLSDIRGCGALEQDAHTVTFLWDANAKESKKPASDEKKITTPEYWWIVRKNRNGPCGKFRLHFAPEKMLFTAVAEETLPVW